MRGEKRGKTFTHARIDNHSDLDMARQGLKTAAEVRSLEVDALVDTGATTLCLPAEHIRSLGLAEIGRRRVKTATGKAEIGVYGPAQITIMGRDCRVDVFELPGDSQPLLGYLPLEWMDLQIDPKGERLVPNPEHGDEMILDLL